MRIQRWYVKLYPFGFLALMALSVVIFLKVRSDRLRSEFYQAIHDLRTSIQAADVRLDPLVGRSETSWRLQHYTSANSAVAQGLIDLLYADYPASIDGFPVELVPAAGNTAVWIDCAAEPYGDCRLIVSDHQVILWGYAGPNKRAWIASFQRPVKPKFVDKVLSSGFIFVRVED